MTRALFALLLGLWALLIAAACAGRPLLVLAVALTGLLAWQALERESVGAAEAWLARWPWLAPLLLVLVVGAVTWPTLAGGFLGDDYGYVQLFDRKSLPSFLRLGDISEGIWGHPLDELRPVFALSYKLGLLWHGADPRGFHADNLAVHVLDCLLVYALLRALEPRARLPGLCAGLLFGLMPVHAEPIAWVTGKVDSLPTCFYLATLVLYVRARRGAGRGAYAAALFVFALGLLSKEILITLPAVLLAYELLLGGRLRAGELLLRLLPFVGLTLGFLAVRRAVFDTFAREGRASSPEHLWQFLRLQPEKLGWLLVPFERWDLGECLAAGLLLGAVGGAGLRLWRRRSEHGESVAQAVFLGGALYGLTLAPLLVTYSSARHMYLPSVGVAGTLGLLLFPVSDVAPRRAGRLALLAALGLALVFGWQLSEAQARWTDAGALAGRARQQLEERLRPLPAGTTLVVAGLPSSQGPLLVFKFALPFALQPPFAAKDTYTPYRVIEAPDVYCCPLRRWWQDKRGLLESLMVGDPQEPLELALAHWNERRGEVVVRQGRPTRGLVRRLVERALGAPWDATVEPDDQAAQRLVGALAESVRVGGPATPSPGQ